MLLYETLSQPVIFLIIFGIGLGSGLIFDLRKYLDFLTANKKIVGIMLDILATIIVCGVLYFSNLAFNYGQFRFYIPLSFFAGLIIERYTLGLFVAKICSWCYTKFRNLVDRFYEKRANKKKGNITD